MKIAKTMMVRSDCRNCGIGEHRLVVVEPDPVANADRVAGIGEADQRAPDDGDERENREADDHGRHEEDEGDRGLAARFAPPRNLGLVHLADRRSGLCSAHGDPMPDPAVGGRCRPAEATATRDGATGSRSSPSGRLSVVSAEQAVELGLDGCFGGREFGGRIGAVLDHVGQGLRCRRCPSPVSRAGCCPRRIRRGWCTMSAAAPTWSASAVAAALWRGVTWKP